MNCTPHPLFFGLEIGGTKLQLVSGNANGDIESAERFSVDPEQGARGIRAQFEARFPHFLKQGKPAAVGIGFGGPVNRQTGCISRSHQIEGWAGFDLGRWVAEAIEAPVALDNDANLAALGEGLKGAGAGSDPVFYTTLGSGVGGGLVCKGEVYHGALPGESEIGHLRLSPEGPIVEEVCSGWAMDRKIRAVCEADPDGMLAGLCRAGRGPASVHLTAALEAGDAVARALLGDLARTLAFGLSHVVHLVHPAVIVLGGGLSKVGEPLRIAVQEALEPMVMEVFRPVPEIRLAALGENAVPIGALLAAARCVS